MMKRRWNLKLIAATSWICILVAFATWLEVDTWRMEREVAMNTANAFFQQVMVSRQWNASHGGVYVPVTDHTPPNPYLPFENRDINTESGLKLTKINPSYMTRQMADMSKAIKNGIQFHITSLNPLRPENKAADWEAKWLLSFEQGVQEQGEYINEGGMVWFRYMAPLVVQSECLQCHAAQGYKEGDIRGGISISLPHPSHSHLSLITSYVAVAAIGLIFILLGAMFYARKQRLFDATFDSPVPSSVTGLDGEILMANDAYWALFGPLPEGKKSIKCHEHRPGKLCHTPECPLARLKAGALEFTYETIKHLKGGKRYFIVSVKPLRDGNRRVIGCVESYLDITARKQAEEMLSKTNSRLEALSITDGLTGIANRRQFDRVLIQEYNRHVRSGAKLSLLILDIDFFKQFNDRYGHVEGDKCLQQVASVLAGCASRPADLAARYGGEEFACILPETGRHGAMAVAEQIRCGIMACAISHQDSKIAQCVTASIGGVTVRCKEEVAVEEVVRQADELLYRAKTAGRNRVEWAAPAETETETKATLVQLIWREAFCCGNSLIDTQHQALFSTSNKLLDAILASRPFSEVHILLDRLLDDVRHHFNDEEHLLEKLNFPHLDAHAAEHAKLLSGGAEMVNSFKNGTLTAGSIFQFLVNEVVVSHMLGADREYFPFLSPASPDGRQRPHRPT